MISINDDSKEDNFLNLFYNNQTKENIIRNDNIDTAKQLVSNNSILSSLNNSQLIIVISILSSDKYNGQSYINKIITYADDELILQIVKNKEIYNTLNRENRNIINSKLNKNPWISANEIIPL